MISMEKEVFLKYLELALDNLNTQKNLKFNIEAELNRVITLYSEEEVNEKVKQVTYKH